MNQTTAFQPSSQYHINIKYSLSLYSICPTERSQNKSIKPGSHFHALKYYLYLDHMFHITLV